MFVGQLNDSDVDMVIDMILNITADHLNASVDELSTDYDLAHCYTDNW